MFIETCHDERAPVPGSTSEPLIPYPELSGEELTVWQEYLPRRREIRNLYTRRFNTIPDPAMAEIKKANRSFDRIEIWSRAEDPMAVGVIGEEKPRYFSIVRWGDAKLTLEQAKKRLRVEKWLLWSTSTGILSFLVATLVAAARGDRGSSLPLLHLDEAYSEVPLQPNRGPPLENRVIGKICPQCGKPGWILYQTIERIVFECANGHQFEMKRRKREENRSGEEKNFSAGH